jgi:four helix bundle protein
VLGRIKAKRPAAVAPLRSASLDPPCARGRQGRLPRRKQKETPTLKIYGVILEVVGELRAVVGQIERRDGDLARQMRRAMCSVALNVAEGMGSGGRNRPARYHTALGSMQETMACIEVSVALGYIESVDAGLVDRMRKIVGTLVRLVGK